MLTQPLPSPPFNVRLVLLFLTLLLTLSPTMGCDSEYGFSPLTEMNNSLNPIPAMDGGGMGVDPIPIPERRGTVLETPQGHNSYTCACRVYVPMGCVRGFECGLVGTGTDVVVSSSGTRFCDFGTREASICFPSRFTTVEEVEADCSGRVRSAVMLGLRLAFSTCSNGASHCQIRMACTARTLTGTVNTARVGRCESGQCWPEPLRSDLQNARTATYVPRESQLLCFEHEQQLGSSQQNVCGEVGF